MNLVPLTPLTTLKILKGVPFDTSYSDTIYFSNTTQQQTFFNSKVKYTYNDVAPIRLQNKIRVPQNADRLYNCNYIMFQNNNFSTKWFYAFIKNIEFINPNMSELTIEIDVMQTWFFDYTLKHSFVEREHSLSDEIGDNIVAENVTLGEYETDSVEGTNLMDSYVVVLASATTEEEEIGIVGGLYSGVKYVTARIDNEEQVQYLNEYIKLIIESNQLDSVVGIFQMPLRFATMIGEDDSEYPKVQVKTIDPKFDSLYGFTPKNNKLYTFPYCYLEVDNSEGQKATYPYERFRNENPKGCNFTMICSMSCDPQILIQPMWYETADTMNDTEIMTMSCSSPCAIPVDSFKAYIAQNLLPVGMNVGSGIVNTVSNPLGGVQSVANSLTSVYQEAIKPPRLIGNQGNSTLIGSRMKDFYFSRKRITIQYARLIDEYFSMYGYATKRVKIPNRTGRQSWNYVKTINCKAVGSIPFDDMEKIKNCYNNGITFWHGDYVGDYNRNNNIV